MTQDELLRRIAIVGDTSIEEALRAVVELHRPYESTDNGLLCRYEVNSNSPYHWYPCETIQAIERELK
jgi:hypothetical protein